MELCRKQGVSHIQVDNIKFKLNDELPATAPELKTEPASNNIPTPDAYTEEQILMWSSSGPSEQ